MKDEQDPPRKWPDNSELRAAMLAFSELPDAANHEKLARALATDRHRLALPFVYDADKNNELSYASFIVQDGVYTVHLFTVPESMHRAVEVDLLSFIPFNDIVGACVADGTQFIVIDPFEEHCVAVDLGKDEVDLYCPKHRAAGADPSSLRMS